jgi:hypothetical protein
MRPSAGSSVPANGDLEAPLSTASSAHGRPQSQRPTTIAVGALLTQFSDAVEVLGQDQVKYRGLSSAQRARVGLRTTNRATATRQTRPCIGTSVHTLGGRCARSGLSLVASCQGQRAGYLDRK